MDGGSTLHSRGRSTLYCVLPEHLAAELHEPLRKHFRREPHIEVVVEQRSADRRRKERRRDRVIATAERRRVRNEAGRRVGDRRAPALAVEAPLSLPPAAERYVELIVFLSCCEPGSDRAEDLDSGRLVTRFQAGETDVFGELYRRYFERVYTYLLVVLSDAEQAEDAAQQVFAEARRLLPDFELRPRHPFRTWLFSLVRDTAVDRLRERAGVPAPPGATRSSNSSHVFDDPDLHALDVLSDRELVYCVESLPLDARQALMLRYMLGLGSRETASVLSLTREDAIVLQHQAMEALRTRLRALTRGDEVATGSTSRSRSRRLRHHYGRQVSV